MSTSPTNTNLLHTHRAHTNRRKIGIVMALTAALPLVACGEIGEGVAERVAERAAESQGGGNVDIDTDSGSVSIDSEDGSADFATGSVPDDWPDDVPLPDDLTVGIGGSTATADGHMVSIQGESASSPDQLVDDMRTALSDWEMSGETTFSSPEGRQAGAQWERDGRTVVLGATAGSSGPTIVSLAFTTTTG